MSEVMYCTNHPQTETLLRCNKCGRPMCLKCVERTVVGYRCKECLGQQRIGYYNATTFDYVLAAIIGLVLATIVGVIVSLISRALGFYGWILLAIFGGPIGGGIVSESIRAAIGRRRGRYIWLVGCAVVVLGGLLGGGLSIFGPLLFALAGGGTRLLAGVGGAFLLNIGFWIYLVLAVGTTYGRLRV